MEISCFNDVTHLRIPAKCNSNESGVEKMEGVLWSSPLPSTLTFADVEWEAMASVAYNVDEHAVGNDSV
jgi:hypothetical protein